MPYVADRAPAGWRKNHPGPEQKTSSENTFEEVELSERKQAWAQLIAKVYEVDPLVCPKCGYDMKVVAVIDDPAEIRRILRHLIKIGPAVRRCDAQPFSPRRSSFLYQLNDSRCFPRRATAFLPNDCGTYSHLLHVELASKSQIANLGSSFSIATNGKRRFHAFSAEQALHKPIVFPTVRTA